LRKLRFTSDCIVMFNKFGGESEFRDEKNILPAVNYFYGHSAAGHAANRITSTIG
jgi:hypothetical protein